MSASPSIYQVALTFDDGPHPDSTPALLDALVAAGRTATFFVCGNQVEAHPELLRAIQASGMWIGNHTFTHAHLTEIPSAAVIEEITRTQEAVASVTGVRPTLFRPPYGETNARIRVAAAAAGLAEELWSVDTRDWAGVDADAIVDAAGTVEAGGVVLMHDGGYRTTVDAVPRILRALDRRGLRPGPVPGRER